MDAKKEQPPAAPSGPKLIETGHTVIVRLPNKETRSVKLDANGTVTLGRFGSFHVNELVGEPYGMRYEIRDKKLTRVPPLSMEELEDTDANNELINDGQFVQPLTAEEIEALKRSGVDASEIIKKQVEQHPAYQLKTEYSKEKYKKRKEAKFSKYFTVVEPTLYNVCEYWFEKDQNRIRDIRSDSLAQMLSLGNVHPGGRYLIVDDASGIIVAAVLERLGGDGRVLTICDIEGPPPYPVMTQMNFHPSMVTHVLNSLNWSTVEEDYTPVLASEDVPLDDAKSDRHKSRLNKRKVVNDSLTELREEFLDGGFDGLLVASQYEPLSILEKLTPYLAGSASIVVHSPYVQVVTDLQSSLRTFPQYLGLAVTEAWLRRYQVLPGRTHPMMAMSGSGGFLLHTIKVYDDPAASSMLLHRQKKKKPPVNTTIAELEDPRVSVMVASVPAELLNSRADE